jgi:YD repeat-containing protein
MKKLTLLLFAAVFTINAGIAQRLNYVQKVMPDNTIAQKKIADLKMANPMNRLNLPFIFSNASNQLFKSGTSIKLDSIIILSRTSDSSPWSRYNKQVFIYDDELRLVEISSTNGLYSNSNWPEKAVFSYNANGKVDSIHLYSKIPDYPDCCTIFNFTYDDMGRMWTAYSYYLYDGFWEINVGKNFSYNAAGKVSEIFAEENWWSYWTSLHQYYYNNAGKLVSYVNDFYSIQTSYEWNADGNLTDLHYQSWHQQRDQAYEYDANGNRVKSKREYSTKDWNSEILTLLEKSSEIYSYLDINSSNLVDLNLSLLDQGNELDAVEYCPEKLLSTVDYMLDYSAYPMNTPKIQKSDYFYSSVIYDPKSVTEINERQDSEFAVFPNPASDQVTFTWKTAYNRLNLKIFQLTGSCVTNMEISSNETINLEKLPKGIYIFKLIDNKHTLKSGKLVIQ